ncbi:MAG: cobalamin B12-binding domain-containing protein, partial [Bacillota bacterium]
DQVDVHDTFYVHKQTYLNYLLEEQSKDAINYIIELKKQGFSIDVIYEDILQPVMKKVGELWHKNMITVDKEHYITSITQVTMAQFYQDIFSTSRKNHTLIACSVGSELHEMGARMVSDLFEYHGWDSTYLGAAVPEIDLLNNIESNQPDLVVLSVTMPQHLLLCKSLIEKIKALDAPPKIAVGGRAFTLTNDIWKTWPVDTSKPTAHDLVEWAESTFDYE